MKTPPPPSFLRLLVLIASITAAIADAPSAYELLERYDFPRGLLPEGVQSYLLRSDGSFDVYLGGSADCEFMLTGGYTLRYGARVSGRVQPGKLTEMKGVSVRVLFLWFGIDQVVRDGDHLDFHVGLLSAAFPVENFDQCPRCGCGFDCQDGDAGERRPPPLSET
ncbi:uncharacterized protein LOC121967985 [Zingiber officinale]|uniref:Uncharacterized protein n=1 Tax=Zingiber officinale TaxID=94328 RepID=A0A8J5H5Y1_ZINOF|nr:uncharacterized protein LOC121967985 [Zingiber officinale]KAG6517229.1 hypothetical protein ZIOFF_020609 [Zingiber officinale]